MDSTKPEISFIIVNFKSRELLPRCLSSIQKLSGIRAEIILVNNDSEYLEALSSADFPIKIIQAPHNLGFGAGVNLGAQSTSGKYLFLLNPDAEIISAPFQDIFHEFGQNNNLAILGGKIVDDRGKIQPWIAGESITPLRIIKNNLGLSRDKQLQKQTDKLMVDWISGGAMLIRKDIFQKLGGFDEKMFMYFEDIDLCRHAKNQDFDLLYFPDLIIQHSGGASFKGKKEQKKYYYQSQEYYFKKHFGKLVSFLMKLLRLIFHPESRKLKANT
jgi:GT2 family glycosyltransferase